MATSSETQVGIDVSKDRLAGGQYPAGIVKLVQQMQEVCPELIMVEATGGYQRAVVDALFLAGLAVAVVNLARVRQFARACGLLPKTDKLDAQVLAVFGQRVQPRCYEGKSQAGQQLSTLLVRRRQLEEIHLPWRAVLGCASSSLFSMPCCATGNLSACSYSLFQLNKQTATALTSKTVAASFVSWHLERTYIYRVHVYNPFEYVHGLAES